MKLQTTEQAREAARQASEVRVVRYAVTFIDSDGCRRLAFSQTSRDTYDTREEAEAYRVAVLANAGAHRIRQLWGENPRFAVSEVTCWHHGDPVGGGGAIGKTFEVAE